MFEKREEKSLARPSEPRPLDGPKEADKLYGQYLAEVFKEYLPYVSSRYSVLECPFDADPTESVASFEVSKLVLEKDGKVLEKLKNVYHLLAYSDSSIAVVLKREHRKCSLHVAIGTSCSDSERAKNLASNVRDAFVGNFPGSECGPVKYFSDAKDGAFSFLNESARFGNVEYSSIAAVSNIATDFSDEFATQGIERLIDGIALREDEEYALMLVAQAVPSGDLTVRKERLCELYTKLSPFASVQRSWGVNESTTWTKGVSAGLFGSSPMGSSPTLGANIGFNVSKGTTIGTTANDTVTITEYGVKHVLDTMEKQVERLEECEALGLWRFSAYVVSPSVKLVDEASRMYLSLTQGHGSFIERPAVNVWNAQRRDASTRDDIRKIRSYLMRLKHPRFEKRGEGEEIVFNEPNWPKVASCAAELSGAELTKAMNVPRSSIPGLPVIECAPFGREVSSYDGLAKGDLTLGCIHHMHHDENMPVEISSSSLPSHVFVTGSTGSGKTNTVCKLLDEYGGDFLVIEPAKGEYRNEFGSDVNVLGTNFLVGDLLRINPFVFPKGIHVYEHIDRILEVFNVCWPMYAAMPAVLKEAVIRAYKKVGWDLRGSRNDLGDFYPTFKDVCDEVDAYIESSDYSADTKGDYRGSLKTRLESLTNGINELVFCNGCTPDEVLFDSRTVVDLSRVGSSENKSLIMGILVIKLQEHRMCQKKGSNEALKHVTVIEEAHNLLRAAPASASVEMGGGVAAKAVEMLANAIAEMRTYGEGFVIVDQAPGLLDMSVIRNTNTKIIMRLPDKSDRELVGRAANLNDEQIDELARLQKGIAAIYQNEWTEPVLCHIGKHERREAILAEAAREDREEGVTEEEAARLNSCVYDPRLLDGPSGVDFVDCLKRAEAPDSLKAVLTEMARTPLSMRRGLFSKGAYEWFKMDAFFETAPLSSLDDLEESLKAHLGGFAFEEGTGPGTQNEAWYRFEQMMMFERASRMASHASVDDATSEAMALSAIAGEVAKSRLRG